jgi:hypothetical protein
LGEFSTHTRLDTAEPAEEKRRKGAGGKGRKGACDKERVSPAPQLAAGSDMWSTPERQRGWRPAIDHSLAGVSRDGRRPSATPLLPGVAVHSAHKEEAMEDHSLTLGAHFLLWVFPLILVVAVIAESLLDARTRDDGQ